MKAILFDLFETLVTEFHPNWKPPRRSTAERLGLPEAKFRKLWPEYDRAVDAGTIRDHGAALAKLCADAGVKPDAKVVPQLFHEYETRAPRAFASIDREISNMLVTLRHSGMKLGVVSNVDAVKVAPWTGSPLAPLVDDFVASYQVGLLKPDKRIYELACTRLAVEPKDAVFVGDGGADELKGAVSAGLTAYWCTWYLDHWPIGRRPNTAPGDDWRQHPTGTPPYPRLARPGDLLSLVLRST